MSINEIIVYIMVVFMALGAIDRIIGNPLAWPEPEPVALGSTAFPDAGNVNASVIQNMHFLAYYSGTAPDTFVAVSAAAAPAGATGENAVPGKQD